MDVRLRALTARYARVPNLPKFGHICLILLNCRTIFYNYIVFHHNTHNKAYLNRLKVGINAESKSFLVLFDAACE